MASTRMRTVVRWGAVIGPIFLLLASARLVWEQANITAVGLGANNAFIVWTLAAIGVVASAVWFVTGFLKNKVSR